MSNEKVASKPITEWNKSLRLDVFSIFKSLSNIAAQGAIQNWSGVANSIIDLASAVSLAKTIEEVAWLLIVRSSAHAMYNLIDQNKEKIRRGPLGNIAQKQMNTPLDRIKKILTQVDKIKMDVDKNLFKRPKDMRWIQIMSGLFSELLEGVGYSKNEIPEIAEDLPREFIKTLEAEWLNHSDEYKRIAGWGDLIIKAADQERAWPLYLNRLKDHIDKPLFHEAITLRQIYIPLRAFYIDSSRNEIEWFKKESKPSKWVVTDLERELNNWLRNENPEDAIKLISGEPGCGKSSFAKTFAAHQADNKNRRVLLVPLYELQPMVDLVKAIEIYVRDRRLLSHNPLDPEYGESRLLLILDGLDELSMQGKGASELAQHLIREIERLVDLFNRDVPVLKVVISGRELFMQANVTGFNRTPPILNILPYHFIKQAHIEYRGEDELINQDQRQLWWVAYGMATDQEYKSIPEPLNRSDLEEITAQPLLNHLVSILYIKDAFDFSKKNDLNEVYEGLIRAIYNRVWAQKHPATEGVSEDEFFHALEVISLTIWHGNGRTTDIKKVESYCNENGLNLMLERFKEGATQGLTRLLVAFYFRRAEGVSGDETFEFTHKSFNEYLTARLIVRTLHHIEKRLDLNLKTLSTNINNQPALGSEQIALLHWLNICGPCAIDHYMMRLIESEVRSQHDQGVNVTNWQKVLSHLISYVLRHGCPFDLLKQRSSFQEEKRQARNAEEALLILLSICAGITKSISTIDWPTSISFGEWISFLQGQRPANPVVLDCLSYLDLQGAILEIKDLYGAKLEYTNLSKADLLMANLEGASLKGAILDKAILKGANLQDANLENACLKEANLQEAYCQAANLQHTNLSGANMQDAIFRKANLKGANVEKALLTGANFQYAITPGPGWQWIR